MGAPSERGVSGGPAAVAIILALLLPVGAPAFAAGVEHPDLGTIALGRGGAYAADPMDGLALQYNPAGFANQRGLRVTVDANLSWQRLSFTPAGGGPSAANDAPPFVEPGGAVSF